MKKKTTVLIALLCLFLNSCISTKADISKKNVSKKIITKTDKILAKAVTYKGVGYRYGGTTRRGMDCSGLIYTVFKSEGLVLPRVSRFMATKGSSVSLKNIQKGDLLFFKTSGRNRINHVGLVTIAKNGVIRFIHSTTSRGVIESSLSEKYWQRTYTKAKRVL